MKSLLRITLVKPDHNHKITFFETPSGDFDRVDHHGDAVTWQHHITLGEVGYTIYACSELGYSIERKSSTNEI